MKLQVSKPGTFMAAITHSYLEEHSLIKKNSVVTISLTFTVFQNFKFLNNPYLNNANTSGKLSIRKVRGGSS